MRSLLLGVLVASAGCTGSIDVDSCTTPGCVSETALSTVKGFTVNVAQYTLWIAQHQGQPPTDAQILSHLCIVGTPVYAAYEGGGQSETVLTDELCRFELSVEKGRKLHLVVAHNDATAQLGTYSQEALVADAPLEGVHAYGLTTESCALQEGLAAVLHIDARSLLGQGACFFASAEPGVTVTSAYPVRGSFSFALPKDYEVWAATNLGTLPPAFAQSDASPVGYYGIVKPGLTAPMTITVAPSSNDATPYRAGRCDLIPGLFTYAPAIGF